MQTPGTIHQIFLEAVPASPTFKGENPRIDLDCRVGFEYSIRLRDVIRISEFEPSFRSLLPTTHQLLMASNLTMHPDVSRIILHGSRGLSGGYRPDSDIDLSLMVDMPHLAQSEFELQLKDIWKTTMSQWRSDIELYLAIVFDIHNCELKCFNYSIWDEQICTKGASDCFGLYKTGRGFGGLVTNAGVQEKLMYPSFKIWERVDADH